MSLYVQLPSMLSLLVIICQAWCNSCLSRINTSFSRSFYCVTIFSYRIILTNNRYEMASYFVISIDSMHLSNSLISWQMYYSVTSVGEVSRNFEPTRQDSSNDPLRSLRGWPLLLVDSVIWALELILLSNIADDDIVWSNRRLLPWNFLFAIVREASLILGWWRFYLSYFISRSLRIFSIDRFLLSTKSRCLLRNDSSLASLYIFDCVSFFLG
jgi:hypothetical protein